MNASKPTLAKVVPAGHFSPEQRALILQTCCGGASESEARALVAIAEARGLNPLTGECYFVKRYDRDRGVVWAVQASIDSFRIKAEETGDYAGQDEPEFDYDDRGRLERARVRVYRKSVPGRPFAVGVAKMSEYVQTTKEGKPTRFWERMPENQLAKCAESLALRKAFPKVLSKIYTSEEMAQADNDVPNTTSHATAPLARTEVIDVTPRSPAAAPKAEPAPMSEDSADRWTAVAKQAIDAVHACHSVDELVIFGAEIRKIPDEFRQPVRDAYAARKKVLAAEGGAP